MSDLPQRLEASTEAVWKCAGCGISSPEKRRVCDCATEVVYQKIGTTLINDWKIGPNAKDAEAISTTRRDEGKMSNTTLTVELLAKALRMTAVEIAWNTDTPKTIMQKLATNLEKAPAELAKDLTP
jgi:hypothetical protein